MSYYNPSDLDIFMTEIDKCINYGNPNMLLNTIKKYKNIIEQKHIDAAMNMYNELINEIIESLVIT